MSGALQLVHAACMSMLVRLASTNSAPMYVISGHLQQAVSMLERCIYYAIFNRLLPLMMVLLLMLTPRSMRFLSACSAATRMTVAAKSGSDTTSALRASVPSLPLEGSLARGSTSASTAAAVAPGAASRPAAVASVVCGVKSEHDSDDPSLPPEEQRRVKR